MTTNTNKNNLIPILLSIIPLIMAIFYLPSLVDVFAFQHAFVVLPLCFLLLLLALFSRSLAYWHQWTGIARLPLFLLWAISGMNAAILSLLAAAILEAALQILWKRQNRQVTLLRMAENIANLGISLLLAQAIYLLVGGDVGMILRANPPYFDALPAMIAFAMASLFSLVFALRLQNEQARINLDLFAKEFSAELSVFLLSFGLPLSLMIFGEAVFAILFVLVAIRNLRQIQISHTEHQLEQRIREISTLNSLGHAVSSQLSLISVLETIYREVTALIPVSNFYIVLYDDEQQLLDYRFVMQNNKPVQLSKQKLADGVVDYVIRERQSLFFMRDGAREQILKGINPQTLHDAQYMVFPLMVSEKMLGALGLSHATESQAYTKSDFELIETIASQASLAIRNAMLYERTVRLADNLAVINQSLHDVMFNLERKDAVRVACDIARSVTRAQKAAVFLLQPNRDNRMERIQAVGFEGLDFIESMEYRPDIFFEGARVIPSVAETSFKDIQEQAKKGAFQACVQIPLRSGNTIVGCLAIYHDNPYYYEATEVNLLTMLSNQITAALDNADLLQALELYAAEQAQLVHLSRISGISLDIELIIRNVCELLSQMIKMSHVEIGLYNRERGLVRFEHPDEDTHAMIRREVRLAEMPELEYLLQADGLSGLRTFYNDSPEEKHSSAFMGLFEELDSATIAILPMRINQQTIGLMLLADSKHRIFNDNDYRLLEMASNQVTAQIHNAQVHTLTEEALVQRLEQLGLIEEIAQQISQALDSDVVIENVLEAALQSTQAEFASIALLDDIHPNTYQIIWREVVGDKLMPDKVIREIVNGTVGYVARTGESLLISDNRNFPEYLPPPSHYEGFLSSLAVPLKKGEKVIGVLNVESVELDFFTTEQESFLKSLAGHAAISIDNAYLLSERERQIHTLTLLRELSLDALSVIEPDEVIQSVLRTGLVLLEAQEAMLYRYDDAEELISFVDGIKLENGQLVKHIPYLPESIVYETVDSAMLQLIADISEHPAYSKYDKLAEVNHTSLLAIPVVRRRKVHEVLCIGFGDKYLFNHHDLNSIDLLSVQLAGHLENAALNQTIHTNSDRMRTVLDSTRDGILLLNLEGRIQEVNQAASKLSGIDFTAHLQENLQDLVKLPELKSDTWRKIIAAYDEQAESIHEKEYAIQIDERISYIKTLVFAVTDEAGTMIGRLLVMRDITQETELRDFRDRMQSYVLHDLRGPLSSIITSMYVAMNLSESVSDEGLLKALMSTLQVSLDSANDLLHMVDTLRDLPMMSEMQIEPQMVSLRDLAEKAYNSLSSNLKESNIDVNFDVSDEAQVYVDANLIRRVIMNLMHNAFKFTPENGKILVRMDADAAKQGYIRVLLADTGPGIPAEERDRIFGRFIQIKGRKPRAGGKGLGLGLNFCKMAVEAHGGQIWVEAESPLSGACFAFTLPMSPSVELANIKSSS